MARVARLLVICRHPYHLRDQEAEDWLSAEIEAVLRRDRFEGATLTKLANPSPSQTEPSGWLVEIRLETTPGAAPIKLSGALGDLLGDLRLLGMAPMVLTPDDQSAIELGGP
jgi:hypothetical protein